MLVVRTPPIQFLCHGIYASTQAMYPSLLVIITLQKRFSVLDSAMSGAQSSNNLTWQAYKPPAESVTFQGLESKVSHGSGAVMAMEKMSV